MNTSPQELVSPAATHSDRATAPSQQDEMLRGEPATRDNSSGLQTGKEQNKGGLATAGVPKASPESAQPETPAALYPTIPAPDGIYPQSRPAGPNTGSETMQDMVAIPMELNGTALGFPSNTSSTLMRGVPVPCSLPVPVHIPQAIEHGTVVVAGTEMQLPAPMMFPYPPEGIGFSVAHTGLGPQPIGVPDLVARIHELEEHNKQLQNEKARLERQLEAFLSLYEVVVSATNGLQDALSQQGLSVPDLQQFPAQGRKRKQSGSLSVPRVKKAKGKDTGTVPQVRADHIGAAVNFCSAFFFPGSLFLTCRALGGLSAPSPCRILLLEDCNRCVATPYGAPSVSICWWLLVDQMPFL